MTETYYNRVVAHLNDLFLEYQHRLNLIRDLQSRVDEYSPDRVQEILEDIRGHQGCELCAGFSGREMPVEEIRIPVPYVEGSDREHVGNDFSNEDVRQLLIEALPSLVDIVYDSEYHQETVPLVEVDFWREELIVRVPAGADKDFITHLVREFAGV